MFSAAIDQLVKFWQRYESLNLTVAFFLISLQLVHLYWLTADVVIRRISGDSAFALQQSGPANGAVKIPYCAAWIAILIDYLELPVIADLF